MSEINKDLVRWKRGQWLAVIGIVLVIQIAAAFYGARKETPEHSAYPSEPTVALKDSALESPSEQIENPFLFAAASKAGFSGEAWLRKPDWQPPQTRSTPPLHHVNFVEAQKLTPFAPSTEKFALLQRRKPELIYPEPAIPPAPARGSRMRIEGLEGRRLLSPTDLPAQYHDGALSSTEVEALVGADGLVITARVTENSGSSRADAAALTLAQRARFSPRPGADRTPEQAKLIFDWHGLHLSQTNNAPR